MTEATGPLEDQIARWRRYLARRGALVDADVEELESHLRDQIDALERSGLDDDEAFLVAVKRLGAMDDLSREYAREHSERLWKQLVLGGDASLAEPRSSGWTAVAVAVCSGLAVVVPALAGATSSPLYARLFCVSVLGFVAVFFLVRRGSGVRVVAPVLAALAAAAALLGLYPFDGEITEVIAVAHVVVALWIVAGVAYVDGRWRSSRRRMDFLRFSGEWYVYMALLALGGGALLGITVGVFAAVDIDATPFIQHVALPGGFAGATVIAAWLVEAKQGVIENIAPVLTRLFTPLFAALLLALVAAGVVQRDVVGSDRELLILFDVVLVVVIGLLLYTWSAREPAAPAGWFEWLQLAMVVSALVVDAFVLTAMLGRIAEFGLSANKAASLGLNLVLLVNLVGAAFLLWRFVRGSLPFRRLEQWQTSFLPVYLVWAAFVAIVFPPWFGFV